MARDVFPRTISRGPLAGQRFASKWEYQQARARYMGFASYSAERGAKQSPYFHFVAQRIEDKHQMPRANAYAYARQIMGDNTAPIPRTVQGRARTLAEGQRMREIIRRALNASLWDSGDDAADDLFYE